jgi:hypothetical protein
MQHTITFHPNGRATTLYTDKLPLRELGQLSVQRASLIEFNDSTQEWEVFFLPIPHSKIRIPNFSHPSREACLAWEHDQLNK